MAGGGRVVGEPDPGVQPGIVVPGSLERQLPLAVCRRPLGVVRVRARLPIALTRGAITSDGARGAAGDGATGEILVTDLLSGAQARFPRPPLEYSRVILSGGYVFAPAKGRTEIQYCSLWYAVWPLGRRVLRRRL